MDKPCKQCPECLGYVGLLSHDEYWAEVHALQIEQAMKMVHPAVVSAFEALEAEEVEQDAYESWQLGG